MLRIVLALTLICCTPAALAECRPEGRETFATGLEALARGDLPAAGASFAELVRSQPACAEARNNLAVVEAEEGRLNNAAEQLRQALQLWPEYARARMNLQRVEALSAKVESAAPPTDATAIPSPVAGPTPPQPPATAAVIIPFGDIAAIEPPGTTAVVIDVVAQRLCVYASASDAVVGDRCYPIVASKVRTWPRWLMTAVTEPERIRLVDESGQRRLKIAPDHIGVLGDVVYLRQDDFAALRSQTTPWRTSWIVVERPAAGAVSGRGVVEAVRQALSAWRAAWQEKRFDEYVGSYSPAFVPTSGCAPARRRIRACMFEPPGDISVRIGRPSIFVLDESTVMTIFEQWYRSDAGAFHDLKSLRWQRQGTRWTISAEAVVTPLPPE